MNIKKILIILLLMTSVLANAQTPDTTTVQEVRDYLHDCGVFFIATVDGDQPHVRPFGVAEVYEGRLYIQTGKKKDVYHQMMKNPKFEITAVKPSGTEWIRIKGRLVNDDRREVKVYILDSNPDLKSMYSPNDDNTAVLYVTEGEARFCSFSAPERKVRF